MANETVEQRLAALETMQQTDNKDIWSLMGRVAAAEAAIQRSGAFETAVTVEDIRSDRARLTILENVVSGMAGARTQATQQILNQQAEVEKLRKELAQERRKVEQLKQIPTAGDAFKAAVRAKAKLRGEISAASAVIQAIADLLDDHMISPHNLLQEIEQEGDTT